MHARLRTFAVASLLLLASVSVATAQRAAGRVVDSETGAPVPGSLVRALDAGGAVSATTLSNGEGAFTLTSPPSVDVLSVAVERIGYATQTFLLRSFRDPDRLELYVGSAPIELGGLVVTGRQLCPADREGASSVQTLWDEARKSLEVTALTQAGRTVRYDVDEFQRDLRPSDYSALRGTSARRQIVSASPYRAISVEQMTERGWVEGTLMSGMTLFAPTADVLMTDDFAYQHCFRGEVTPDGVLLHFTPNNDRRGIAELEGTLVLDPETAELTDLRFRYTGIPGVRVGEHAGGTIRFVGAPNGMRIVQSWSIRAPVMSRYRTGFGSLARDELRLEYVSENGGRVVSIEMGDDTVRFPAPALDLGAPEGTVDRDEPAQVALVREMRGSAGAELLIRNDDDRPYRVTGIVLRECMNIAIACGEHGANITIAPGATTVVLTLRKERVLDDFRFEWDFVGIPVDPPEVTTGSVVVPAERVRRGYVPPAPGADR